jgi:predicted transposase/invertase (TIGR01784 family)
VQYRYYCPNTTVYTIVVLTSGDERNQCDVAVIDFDPKTLDGKALNEIKHKVIYLCPKYMNERTPVVYREWLRLIEDSLDNSVDESTYYLSEIEKVLAHIEEDGITPQERARMIEESYIENAREESLKEGIEKGIELGMEKGEQRKTIELAKAMCQEGFDIQTIAKITGLTEAEILSLDN